MIDDPIALPGLGRVVFAFVLVVALAVGAVLALRRFGPQLGRGSLFAAAGSMRVLERLQLSRDLSVHLVQTERGQVLITAHRHTIAVVRLDSALDSAVGGGQP
jgi:flagellar biogenesis protein FliO